MNDQQVSQEQLSTAIEAAPNWLSDNGFMRSIFDELAALNGPDGTPSSVRHAVRGPVNDAANLLRLLARAEHVSKDDEELSTNVEMQSRRLVNRIINDYSDSAISDASRQRLIAIEKRIENAELQAEIDRRQAVLKQLDEQAAELSEAYELAKSKLSENQASWAKKLDGWNRELDPKAAELAGQHLTALIRSQRRRSRRVSYFWLGAAIVGFVVSAVVAIVLVVDVPSLFGTTIALRQRDTDTFTAPLSGLALLALVTGGMTWAGRRYLTRSADADILEDLADRITLAARLDAAEFEGDVGSKAYQLLSEVTAAPLIERSIAASANEKSSREQLKDAVTESLKSNVKPN